MNNQIFTTEDLHLFDDLFPPKKIWFSPKEVGYIIGTSDQFVRNAFQSGQIMGYRGNGKRAEDNRLREYIRINKKDIIIFLLRNTNYNAEHRICEIGKIINSCNKYELFAISKLVNDRIARLK